jgi:hypothetical protein
MLSQVKSNGWHTAAFNVTVNIMNNKALKKNKIIIHLFSSHFLKRKQFFFHYLRRLCFVGCDIFLAMNRASAKCPQI